MKEKPRKSEREEPLSIAAGLYVLTVALGLVWVAGK